MSFVERSSSLSSFDGAALRLSKTGRSTPTAKICASPEWTPESAADVCMWHKGEAFGAAAIPSGM